MIYSLSFFEFLFLLLGGFLSLNCEFKVLDFWFEVLVRLEVFFDDQVIMWNFRSPVRI